MRKTQDPVTRYARPKLNDAVVSLKKLMANYAIGARLPSDRTMAKELGISNVTVSMAMQELERMGWIERKSRSGSYRADINLHRHVAIYSEMDIFHQNASRYYGKLIQRLRMGLADAGLRSLPYIGLTAPADTSPDCTAPWFLQDLEAHRISGVIALSPQGYTAWRERPEARDLPIVGTNRNSHRSVNLSPDFMATAVRMLAARGCQRIAILMWDTSTLPSAAPIPGSHLALFKEAMTECGLTVRPEWVRGDLHPTLHGAGWEELREIWAASSEKPDGLIVTDDVLFRDAAYAFPELGIVPGRNVDVVSLIVRELEPPGNWPIIRAVVDASTVAREMVSCLTDWMQNVAPAASRHILVKPTWEFPDRERAQAFRLETMSSTKP